MIALKNTGRIVGALFLIVMISWTIGDTLTGSILNSSEYLTSAFAGKTKVLAGVFFELIDVIAVIGITSLMFPLFRAQNESFAIAYLSFRLIEVVALIVALISPVLIIELSRDFMASGLIESSYHAGIGNMLQELRSHWSLLINAFFYNLGALIFYSFLYRIKLIPRAISVWGIIGVSLLIIDRLTFELFDLTVGAISGLPILGLHLGLIEIFLGVWLIIKGFKKA